MRKQRSFRILQSDGGKRQVGSAHLRFMPAIESHWLTTFDLRWLEHLREERRSSGAGGTRFASTG